MLSRRNAAAFLVLIFAFVATLIVQPFSVGAQQNLDCSPRKDYSVECGKEVKTATGIKYGGKNCSCDEPASDGKMVKGVCVAALTCKANKTAEDKAPKTCVETGECTPGDTNQTPQQPQQQPQQPQQDGGGGQPPSPPSPPPPTPDPKTQDPKTPDPKTPDPTQPTDTNNGAATNPWLSGETPPQTGDDPNNPTNNPDALTPAQTNPFGEQIRTAERAQEDSWFSGFFGGNDNQSSLTPPSSDGNTNSSLYNQVTDPLGSVTGFQPTPDVSPSATPDGETPASRSISDTLSSAWDSIKDLSASAWEGVTNAANSAYDTLANAFSPAETPSADPLAGADTPPAGSGAEELIAAEREMVESANPPADRPDVAPVVRDPEIVAAENELLQQRLEQADREQAAYEKALREAETKIPAPETTVVDPKNITEQINRDIENRIPEPPRVAQKDPQTVVERTNARETLARDYNLPPVRETQDLKDAREIPQRIHDSNQRVSDLANQYDALDRARTTFMDKNLVDVDKSGQPVFANDADKQTYNNMVQEQQRLASELRGEAVQNDVLRTALTEKYNALPAETRALAAVESNRAVLESRLAEAVATRDALQREAPAPQINPDPMNPAMPPMEDPALTLAKAQVAQLEQQLKYNETLQSCLANCTNRADVANALLTKAETPAQEIAREGLLKHVALWGSQQDTLARAQAIDTLYGQTDISRGTTLNEIANRSEQIGKIDGVIADFNRVVNGLPANTDTVSRYMNTVLEDRLPTTVNTPDSVVLRKGTEAMNEWAAQASEKYGIPVLLNPVAWAGGILDSALSLYGNPTASRQFSELSMLDMDRYALKAIDVINVATTIEPFFGSPLSKGIAAGMDFARSADFYGATFAGRTSPFTGGVSEVAPGFGTRATDLEFTRGPNGVWGYTDNFAAQTSPESAYTRLLAGPTGDINTSPVAAAERFTSNEIVPSSGIPQVQLPASVPAAATIAERAGLTGVTGPTAINDVPVMRTPDMMQPVLPGDLTPSVPRVDATPSTPVASQSGAPDTVVPAASVRAPDAPTAPAAAPAAATPAAAPITVAEVPRSTGFLDRLRNFFTGTAEPTIAPLSVAEANALGNLNRSLSNLSRVSALPDVPPASRQALLNQVSNTYRDVVDAGLSQRVSDGAIVRPNGDVVATKLPVQTAGTNPYVATVPVDSAASNNAIASLRAPNIEPVNPAVLKNTSISAPAPSRGLLPGEVPSARDILINTLKGPAVAGVLAYGALTNPLLSTVADAASPSFQSCVASSCLKPVNGTASFYDPRRGGINIDANYVKNNKAATKSGEYVDMSRNSNINEHFTVASEHYPVNTIVNVCSGSNCLYVRVNDTGSFNRLGRVVDLMPGVVEALGHNWNQGLVQVTQRPVVMFAGTAGRAEPAINQLADNVMRSLNRGQSLADAMNTVARNSPIPFTYSLPNMNGAVTVAPGSVPGTALAGVQTPPVTVPAMKNLPAFVAIDMTAGQQFASRPGFRGIPTFMDPPGTTPTLAAAQPNEPVLVPAANAPVAPTAQEPVAPQTAQPVAAPQGTVTQQLEKLVAEKVLNSPDPAVVTPQGQKNVQDIQKLAQENNRVPPVQLVQPDAQAPTAPRSATPPAAVTPAAQEVIAPTQVYGSLKGDVLASADKKMQAEWIQRMTQQGYNVVDVVNPKGIFYRPSRAFEQPIQPMSTGVSHVTYSPNTALADAKIAGSLQSRPFFGTASFGAHLYVDNCASGKCTIYLATPFDQRANHVSGNPTMRQPGAPNAYSWNSLAIEIGAPNEAAVTPAAAQTLANAMRTFGEVSGQPQFMENVFPHHQLAPKSIGEGDKGVAASRATPQDTNYRPQWIAQIPEVAAVTQPKRPTFVPITPGLPPVTAASPAAVPQVVAAQAPAINTVRPGFSARPANAAQADAVFKDIAQIIRADQNYNLGNPAELAKLNKALTDRGYPPIEPPRQMKAFGVSIQTVGWVQGKTLQVFAGTQALLGQSFKITSATESGHSNRHGTGASVGSAIDFEAAPWDIAEQVFAVPREQRGRIRLPFDSTSPEFQRYRAVIGAATGYVGGRMCTLGGLQGCAVTMGVYPGFGTHLDTINGIANTYNQGLGIQSKELAEVYGRFLNRTQLQYTFDDVQRLASAAKFVDRAPYTVANAGNPNLTAGTPAGNVAVTEPRLVPVEPQAAPVAVSAPRTDVSPAATPQTLPTQQVPAQFKPVTPLNKPAVVNDITKALPPQNRPPIVMQDAPKTPAISWAPSAPASSVSAPAAPTRTQVVKIDTSVNPRVTNFSDVLVATPAGYTPLKPTNVVVYFHGHSVDGVQAGINDMLRRQKVLAQLEGTNSILIAPQLGVVSEAGSITQPGGFAKFMADAAQHVEQLYGKPVADVFRTAPVNVVAYSGGGSVALQAATDGMMPRLNRVVLLDAGYNGNFASGWADWLQRNPNNVLVSGYLKATTARRNGELLAELKKRGVAVSDAAPAGQTARAFIYQTPVGSTRHADYVQNAWAQSNFVASLIPKAQPTLLTNIPPQQKQPVLVKVPNEIAPAAVPPVAAAPAQLPHPYMTPSGTQPYAIGDSIANQLVTQAGIRGSAVVGMGPEKILQMIKSIPQETFRGRTVYLSSGASNTRGDITRVQNTVPQQVAALRAAGADVVLMGVGPKMPAAMNDVLRKIASETQGVRFSPLPQTTDGIHPRDGRELLASLQPPKAPVAVQPKFVPMKDVVPPVAQTPALSGELPKPQQVPVIAVRPVPIEQQPAAAPTRPSAQPVQPPVVTPEAKPANPPQPVVKMVPVRPVPVETIVPPAVKEQMQPKVLPKPVIAQQPSAAPQPLPTVTPQMTTVKSEIANLNVRQNALAAQIKILTEMPRTSELVATARRGLQALAKDGDLTPADFAAMNNGLKAVVQLNQSVRIAGDTALIDRVQKLQSSLTSLNSFAKELKDVVNKKYGGSMVTAYFQSDPLMMRTLALRTAVLKEGEQLTAALANKNYDAAVQAQRIKLSDDLAAIHTQISALQADYTRLAQGAQSPSAGTIVAPVSNDSIITAPAPKSPIKVIEVPTQPIFYPKSPVVIDVPAPAAPASAPTPTEPVAAPVAPVNVPEPAVPAPSQPKPQSPWPFGGLVPVYRSPDFELELPPSQSVAAGSASPSPVPPDAPLGYAKDLEPLLSQFSKAMADRPSLTNADSVPAVGVRDIDRSIAELPKNQIEAVLADGAEKMRAAGPLASAAPADVTPNVARAAELSAPASTPEPQVLPPLPKHDEIPRLGFVNVGGERMLSSESATALAQDFYANSPELQAIRSVQARVKAGESFSPDQMRNLMSEVSNGLEVRTGVRFELFDGVERSAGYKTPPDSFPADTNLGSLRVKDDGLTSSNGASLSPSQKKIYIYSDYLKYPEQILDEMIHETNHVLLMKTFGSSSAIPRVLLSPEIGGGPYATHFADAVVKRQPPSAAPNTLASVIEQRGVGSLSKDMIPPPAVATAAPDAPSAPRTGPDTATSPAGAAKPDGAATVPAPKTTPALAWNVFKGSIVPASSLTRNAALLPFSYGLASTIGGPLAITMPVVNIAWKSIFNAEFRADVIELATRGRDRVVAFAKNPELVPTLKNAMARVAEFSKPVSPKPDVAAAPSAPKPDATVPPAAASGGGSKPPSDWRPWKNFGDGWNPSAPFSTPVGQSLLRYGPIAGLFGVLALIPSDEIQEIQNGDRPQSEKADAAECTEAVLAYQNAMRTYMNLPAAKTCDEPLPDTVVFTAATPKPVPTPTPVPGPTVGSYTTAPAPATASYTPAPAVGSYTPATGPTGGTSPTGGSSGDGGTNPLSGLMSMLQGMLPSLANMLNQQLNQNQNQTPTTTTATTTQSTTQTYLPITMQMSVTPNTVEGNAQAIISWTAQNATLCRFFTDAALTQIASGSATGTFRVSDVYSDTTFHGVCSNPGGYLATSSATLFIR